MNSILSKKRPEKRLLKFFRGQAGRNNTGRITVRHQGGGAKQLYRIIEFGQKRLDIPAKILALEYDPNRTAYLALIEYPDKERKYVLAHQGAKEGDEIIFAEKTELKPGNRLMLKNVPVGTAVFNIELEPGRGGKMVRSAGTAAHVLAQEGGKIHLVLPSTETRKVPEGCFATIGMVSHEGHIFEIVPNAGRNRHRGIRPTVRGTAMNPVDHPHGGGEGKTPIGMRYPKTPWGKHAKGVKTRKRSWTNRFIISRRKKK